jgi:carboxyl-terminal processing protease
VSPDPARIGARRARAWLTIVVFSGALVTGGWLLQRGLESSDGEVRRARLFDQVVERVATQFVDTLTEEELYEKAVEGLMSELDDPNSAYLSATRLARLDESTSGNYAGLGIQIDARERWITIIAPLPGTPGERAGLQTGDRIIAIDGEATEGMQPDEARRALRGEPGSRVVLTIDRPGVPEPLVFTVTRAVIHAPSVRRISMLRPRIGYVDVNVFSESTVVELEQAVIDLQKRGMESLILDLRGNPGGLLEQGIAVADLFLDRGDTIVATLGRTPSATDTYVDRSAQRWPSLRMLVLVDRGSASASEIVAGALQDHDRALLIGETTFGKGSAQSVYRLPNGSAIKLTTAKWYTPSGRSIQGPLAEPDEALAFADEVEPAIQPERERFRTDGGRTVLGGGGITPDVHSPAAETDSAALRLQRALGADVPAFRDAITEFALDLKERRAVTATDFTVTPQMLEGLWARLRAQGIALTPQAYREAEPVVSRMLGGEIARYVFGPQEEFLRRIGQDPALSRALALAEEARSTADLFARGADALVPTRARPDLR